MNLRKDHYLEFVGFAYCLLPMFFEHLRFLGGLARRQEPHNPLASYAKTSDNHVNKSQLSTMDLLVLASMKNAAKCDK